MQKAKGERVNRGDKSSWRGERVVSSEGRKERKGREEGRERGEKGYCQGLKVRGEGRREGEGRGNQLTDWPRLGCFTIPLGE